METTWVKVRAALGAARLASVRVSLLGIVLVVGVHAYLPGASREPSGGRSATVVLITGDRVHLQWRAAGGVQATVVPARRFEVSTSGADHLSIKVAPCGAPCISLPHLVERRLLWSQAELR